MVKQDEGTQDHAQVGPAHARLAAEEESRGRAVGISEQQQTGGLLGKDHAYHTRTGPRNPLADDQVGGGGFMAQAHPHPTTAARQGQTATQPRLPTPTP